MRSAFLIPSLLCLGTPAFAGLSSCNDSDIRATVAIGYKGDDGWISEGWWGVDPGQCREVVAGDLPKRYYYWRATTKAGPFPEVGCGFCTQFGAFTIVGDEDCEGRGYRRQMFNELDIGGAADHTVRLSAGDGYTWIVQGNFLTEIYDANIMRESYLEIAPSCAASNGQGPVVIAWPEPDEGDGPSCYLVTETAQRHLAIVDVIDGRSYSFSYSN